MKRQSKKNLKKMSAFAAFVYVINQLVFMLIVIVMGFVLFEYRTGLKDAKYDIDYVRPEVTAPKLSDNKDQQVYTLVINQEQKIKQLSFVSIFKYDKHENETRILTMPSEISFTNNGTSFEDVYFQKGLSEVIKQLEKSTGIELEHYVVSTPYSAQLIVEHFVSKEFPKDEAKRLVKESLKGEGNTRQKSIETLTTHVLTDGFSMAHLLKLPKALGVLSGYSENDFNIKELTSLTKNLTFEDQKNVSFKHLEANTPLGSHQAELLSFFE
ncbi:hypothetical protein [Vagococcus xieshaowenii]|uniref:Cell envelope-related transcriptional attenuator domain-containing protein n=1 Tax=Vagococcus xieshaowenii TaxID=2562451 RepID=A0AAJ5JLH5_9ENTE|nr:hypothetical protein [Vagococcus xieshaowenii]QCA28471.1 hypothetical protein E4Z98_03760 [Vagococcus xieshaowenii]TFZ42774.1 hypothetical protein E4031_01980 [Vagococcus xieshaowenii]